MLFCSSNSWLWSSAWSSCCVTCSRFWKPMKSTGNMSCASSLPCWCTTNVPSPASKVGVLMVYQHRQVEVLCVKGKRKTKFKEKSCTTFIPNQRSDIEINSSFCSRKLVFQRERSTVISVLFCVSDRAAVQTAELCIRRL